MITISQGKVVYFTYYYNDKGMEPADLVVSLTDDGLAMDVVVDGLPIEGVNLTVQQLMELACHEAELAPTY